MKRRILSVLLTLVMLVGILPATVLAADPVYVVAGVDALCGSNWDATDANNRMTLNGSVYQKVFTNVPVGTKYQLKVVKDGSDWIGDATGNNVTFNITSVCDVTVTLNPANNEITVTGTGVSFDNKLDVEGMRTVGNGDGVWLNGATWDPASDKNLMKEIAPNVYQITYRGLEAYDNYQVKFAANGSWSENWGGVFEGSGVTSNAEYNSGNNITFAVTDDAADVTLTLDLSKFDYSTKSGATFTVDIKEPHTHQWEWELNGATVTVKCTGTGTCDYTGTDTSMTIQAPTLTVEGGEGNASATLSGETLIGEALDPANIEYAVKGTDTWSTTAPTAAGEYTARLIVGVYDIRVDYIIETNVAHYDIWVSGVEITSENCNDPANNWSYDPAENVLTLKGSGNVTYAAGVMDFAILAEKALTIKLDGGSSYDINGIRADGNLTVIGVGNPNLTLTASRINCLNTYSTNISGVNNLTLTAGTNSIHTVNGELTANIAGDLTVSADCSNYMLNGGLDVTAGGDVTISNQGSGMLVAGSVTIAAKNIDMAGKTTLPTIGGDLTIAANGSVTVTNDENTTCSLLVAGKVTITGATDVLLRANASAPLISNTTDITATGNVDIQNTGTGIVMSASGSIQGKNVTITGKTNGSPMITSGLTVDAAGAVKVTNDPGVSCSGVVYGALKVLNSTSVEVSGSCSSPMTNNAFDITSTGDVTLVNYGSGMLASTYDYASRAYGNCVVTANNVTLQGKSNGGPLIDSHLTISAAGAVSIVNDESVTSNGVVSGGKLTIAKSASVTVKGNCGAPMITIADIKSSGDVSITGKSGSAPLFGSTVTIDTDGNVVIDNQDTGMIVGGPANISGKNITVSANCSNPVFGSTTTLDAAGDVSVENKGAGMIMAAPSIINGKNITVTANCGNPMFGSGLTLDTTGKALLVNKGEGFVLNGGLTYKAGTKDAIVFEASPANSITASQNTLQLKVSESSDGSGATVWAGTALHTYKYLELVPVPYLTITFQYNDGATADTTAKTDASYKLTELPKPTRAGYVFNGWFDAAEDGAKVDTTTEFADNATVYAYWSVCDHSGNTAKPDCVNGTNCSLCGDPLAALGHKLTHVPAKEATKKADGNKEHWICSRCGKYYADDKAEKEVTKADVIIKYAESPATGDSSNVMMVCGLMLASMMGIAGVAVIGKKRKIW